MAETTLPDDFEPFKRQGGRRFLLCVGCGLITSLLVLTKSLDSTSYTAIVIATIGAYVAGDTMQSISRQKLAAESSKEPAQ